MTSSDVIIERDDEIDFLPPTLSCPEMCRVAGVSYRKIDYWVRCGLITPTREANGSGTQRVFDADQVASVRIVALLVRMNVDHEEIRALVAECERDGVEGKTFEPFPGVTLDLVEVATHRAVPTATGRPPLRPAMPRPRPLRRPHW